MSTMRTRNVDNVPILIGTQFRDLGDDNHEDVEGIFAAATLTPSSERASRISPRTVLICLEDNMSLMLAYLH